MAEIDGRTVSIYALCEPEGGDDDVRYIGQTIDPRRRLDLHISDARCSGTTARSRWLKSLLCEGKSPVMRILQTVPETQGSDAERWWKEHFRAKGITLLNGIGDYSRGGTGEESRYREGLGFAVDAEVKRRVWAAATRRCYSVSEFMRMVVRDWLETHELEDDGQEEAES